MVDESDERLLAARQNLEEAQEEIRGLRVQIEDKEEVVGLSELLECARAEAAHARGGLEQAEGERSALRVRMPASLESLPPSYSRLIFFFRHGSEQETKSLGAIPKPRHPFEFLLHSSPLTPLTPLPLEGLISEPSTP